MIVLLTDFGDSEYVGVMKGVILARAPAAQVVDLFHRLRPQAVREAAWVLFTSYRYFPAGATFLCVVDPEVGTERQAVAVRTERYYFVGPDNGLLWPALAADGVQEAVALPVPAGASRTFHGRDVFAPAAADIERGLPLRQLGTVTRLAGTLAFYQDGRTGEVVRIDPFGNVITNLTATGQSAYTVTLDGRRFTAPACATYAEAPADTLCIIIGSAATLEIAIRNGSAQQMLGAQVGMRIRVE